MAGSLRWAGRWAGLRPGALVSWHLLLIGALPGCSALPGLPAGAGAGGTATVYVIGRDWHTDIAVPAGELTGPLGRLERFFPGARYFSFGFGERHYVLARQPTLLDTLSALWPSPGLMLVTALRTPPPQAFGPGHVVTLRISETGRSDLVAFLGRYFGPGPDGELRAAAPGPYPGSIFFASPGTYSAIYTCNTWTADALRVAGLPVTGNGVVFAAQVMKQAREAGAEQEGSDETEAQPAL